MPRTSKLYLDDIVTAITAIQSYVEEYDYDQFVVDAKTTDAVLHNLAIIGEAASKLPTDVTHRKPTVEWRKIVGFRNIVVHEYFGVNQIIVWDILTNKLAQLAIVCRELLAEDE